MSIHVVLVELERLVSLLERLCITVQTVERFGHIAHIERAVDVFGLQSDAQFVLSVRVLTASSPAVANGRLDASRDRFGQAHVLRVFVGVLVVLERLGAIVYLVELLAASIEARCGFGQVRTEAAALLRIEIHVLPVGVLAGAHNAYIDGTEHWYKVVVVRHREPEGHFGEAVARSRHLFLERAAALIHFLRIDATKVCLQVSWQRTIELEYRLKISPSEICTN